MCVQMGVRLRVRLCACACVRARCVWAGGWKWVCVAVCVRAPANVLFFARDFEANAPVYSFAARSPQSCYCSYWYFLEISDRDETVQACRVCPDLSGIVPRILNVRIMHHLQRSTCVPEQPNAITRLYVYIFALGPCFTGPGLAELPCSSM